jgi:hypothetical protein
MGIWTVFPLNFFYLYINIFKLFWYVNIKQKIKKKNNLRSNVYLISKHPRNKI